jgi:class 3 adenylate cyclase
MAPQTTPANEWAEARPGTGSEHPDELPATNYLQIERTFCFADLSGFTRYTSEHGPLAAVDRLGEFREVSRDVAAKRGVRVAKWLGDGVMMVGTEPTPTIAWGGHVISHFKEAGVEVRAGLATGIALLFEGDDYIGEPVNLAAKLCSVAEPGEILASCDVDYLPDWMQVLEVEEVDIRGVGSVRGIQRLGPRLG